MKDLKKKLLLTAGLMLVGELSMACTRVVYLGDEQNVMTARSMDWKADVGSNIWVLPNNVSRDGAAGKNLLNGYLNMAVW